MSEIGAIERRILDAARARLRNDLADLFAPVKNQCMNINVYHPQSTVRGLFAKTGLVKTIGENELNVEEVLDVVKEILYKAIVEDCENKAIRDFIESVNLLGAATNAGTEG